MPDEKVQVDFVVRQAASDAFDRMQAIMDLRFPGSETQRRLISRRVVETTIPDSEFPAVLRLRLDSGEVLTISAKVGLKFDVVVPLLMFAWEEAPDAGASGEDG